MKKLMNTLLMMSFALALVACGDPAEFEDVPEDEMLQQQNQGDGVGGGEGF